ncbi:Pheromone shutdown protein TraB containing GTxH motif [Methanonatronarchaeum thermophilum]|uniref:Pheromone shutdown protein TraB containing GTxH motif n=1 Tax=Methanonatronarchaeum thermophilum TaxID=1927129 RepID=A0A1Y3GCK7_9EURY|nr:TraB/GumN family protein [Methanonatronarchaeum thermophilum]OUJ19178.1 Pheromone shutdown protein TraB containing GTxH motif [Methanonatronarchaeum thermophilum]
MGKGEIHLLKTAHVSKKSVREVEEAINKIEPDIVAVELDIARYKSLKGEDTEISVRDILKGNVFIFLFQMLLSYLQNRIGADLGVEPGAEMKKAIELAEEKDIQVALIDRDIRITMKRLWHQMTLREKLKMMGSLVLGALGFGDQKEVKIDEITEDDTIEMLLSEFEKFSPNAAKVLINERDAYLAANLLREAKKEKKVLGVIGAGHGEGVKHYLKNYEEIPPLKELEKIPKSRKYLRAIGIIIPLSILALFGYLVFAGQPLSVILTAFGYWFLINGSLAAIAALLARAHPLSIATAFSTAWLTSLSPFLAAGWFAGMSEAYIRKPSSQDLKILKDAEKLDELLNNKLFKVILVAAAANVGSILGTFIGAYILLKFAGIDIETLIP